MSKVEDARRILEEIGMPAKQQNDVSCLTLLALANVGPRTSWRRATNSMLRIHDIMQFCAKVHGKKYAENTREVFRRQVIHQFEHARLVDRNPDDPGRPTNSGLTCYALTPEFLNVIRAYSTKRWGAERDRFIKVQGRLKVNYEKRRRRHKVTVKLPDEKTLRLSPGKHNKLQARIVNDFIPEFVPSGMLLYLGDTAKKVLHIDQPMLTKLSVPVQEHEKLPDIVLYDLKREWLYLIEAVTTHGPVTPKRKFELERLLNKCRAARVYVSAFETLADFRKWVPDIAWETEVWVADKKSHMIHFNGNKFLEP